MKKRFSVLTLALVGFLMMATGVFASELFDRWAGEHDYEATKVIFSDLRDGIVSNKEAKDKVDGLLEDEKSKNNTLEEEIKDLKSDKEQLNADLASKNNTISELEDKVKNSIDKSVLATEIDKHILVVNNSKNGPKHKYDYIMNQVNKHKDFLGLNNELGHHGQSDEDKQLEQAVKDMKEIRDEAQALKELLLNEETE